MLTYQNYNLVDAEFLPFLVKLVPLFLSLGGFFFSFFFNYFYFYFLSWLKLQRFGVIFFTFFNQKCFFDKFYNYFIVFRLFNFSFYIPFFILDKGFIELLGPSGIFNQFNLFSKRISQVQTGFVYHYTFLFLIGIFFYFSLFFLEVVFCFESFFFNLFFLICFF